MSRDQVAVAMRETFEVLGMGHFRTTRSSRLTAAFVAFCGLSSSRWIAFNTLDEAGYTVKITPPRLPAALVAVVAGRAVPMLSISFALSRGITIRAQHDGKWGSLAFEVTYATRSVARLCLPKSFLEDDILPQMHADDRSRLQGKFVEGKASA